MAAEPYFLREREYSYIPPTGSWEDYLRTRSRNFRKEIARVMRKAEESGIRLRELQPSDLPPNRLPDLFLRLHFSRFGDASAFHVSSENRNFVQSALPVLFTQRRLRVFSLHQGRRISGIDLSFMGSHSLCTWNGGYPPEIGKWSPGKLLLVAGIRKALDLGLQEYDLLRGLQEWKARWANEKRLSAGSRSR